MDFRNRYHCRKVDSRLGVGLTIPPRKTSMLLNPQEQLYCSVTVILRLSSQIKMELISAHLRSAPMTIASYGTYDDNESE